MTNKIRTQEDAVRFKLGLIPVDEAFFASETKYGIGRLERLVSPGTLAAYQRGWDAYRVALEEGDGVAIGAITPKMIQMLAIMDAEATAAGHKPLDPVTWETKLGDTGTVLVIVRTKAEATQVIRAAKGNRFTAGPEGRLQTETRPETTLPPDVMLTVRQQHEGRRLDVWCLDEIANLILTHGSVAREKGKWEGTPAHSGVQQDEMAAYDEVRSGFPLDQPLAVPAPSARLAF